MLCLAVTYIAQPGHEEEVIQFLKVMTEHTRQEPGNIMYLAHRSPSEPRRFFLYEQYTGQEAIDAHRAAPYFEKYILNGVLKILESRTPELYEPLTQ